MARTCPGQATCFPSFHVDVNFLVLFCTVNKLSVTHFLMLIKDISMNAATDYLAVLLNSDL